jgi:tetratricopeptide (TPR) repeat protein
MPEDLPGVVDDCNKAIALDPENKNAYFLRGLASYGLGKKEEACTDFYRAIELGFTILKEAEHEKCAAYWESFQ